VRNFHKGVLRGLLFLFMGAALVAAITIGARPQQPKPETVRITFDPGGGLVGFIEKFAEKRQNGTRFIIDGMCISACTMITGLIPSDRVCVTPRAVLAFHSASVSNPFTGERLGHSKVGTEILWYSYPTKLREFLRTKFNWDGTAENSEHDDLMFVEGEDLLTFFKPCKGEA
jgi:hypothetical protein